MELLLKCFGHTAKRSGVNLPVGVCMREYSGLADEKKTERESVCGCGCGCER